MNLMTVWLYIQNQQFQSSNTNIHGKNNQNIIYSNNNNNNVNATLGNNNSLHQQIQAKSASQDENLYSLYIQHALLPNKENENCIIFSDLMEMQSQGHLLSNDNTNKHFNNTVNNFYFAKQSSMHTDIVDVQNQLTETTHIAMINVSSGGLNDGSSSEIILHDHEATKA